MKPGKITKAQSALYLQRMQDFKDAYYIGVNKALKFILFCIAVCAGTYIGWLFYFWLFEIGR